VSNSWNACCTGKKLSSQVLPTPPPLGGGWDPLLKFFVLTCTVFHNLPTMLAYSSGCIVKIKSAKVEFGDPTSQLVLTPLTFPGPDEFYCAATCQPLGPTCDQKLCPNGDPLQEQVSEANDFTLSPARTGCENFLPIRAQHIRYDTIEEFNV